MATRIGRAQTQTPRSIPFQRRGAGEPGIVGPFIEEGYTLQGQEGGSTAQTVMDALRKEALRFESLYVTDDDGLLPSGYYRVESADYEKPKGAPRRRPWSFALVKKERPVIVRQAEDDNVLGTDTADATAEEGSKMVYTATAVETTVLVSGKSLVAEYRLEADGSDSSHHSNLAPLTGAPTFPAAKIGNGMLVGADAQYITPPDLGLSGSTNWTLEFWLNLTEAAAPISGNARGIIMRGTTGGSMGVHRGPTSLLFAVRDTATSTNFSVSRAPVLNTWMHYSFVHNKTLNLLMLYENGVLVGSNVIGTYPTAPPPSGDWQIGSTSRVISGNPDPTLFRGTLDEVRFYPFALTGQEALARYNAVKAGARTINDHAPAIELLNLPVGTWRILARVKSITTVTQRFRGILRDAGNNALTTGALVTVGAGNNDVWTLIDLGAFVVPQANDNANFLTLAVQANPDLNNVEIDQIRIVPA